MSVSHESFQNLLTELSTLKAQQVNRHIRVYLNIKTKSWTYNVPQKKKKIKKITQLINILEKTRTQYNMFLLLC